MRKKLVTKTYLRDVSNYELTLFFDETKDYYVVSKKVIETQPFVISTGVTLIDNGYYIVEITPKNENYNVRAYLDENKVLKQYYIDISLENGLDADAKVPYYTDLYTDITITDGKVEVLDLDELQAALDEGKISKSDFDLAESVKEKLLQEIDDGTNKYLNLDLSEYLK